MPLHMRAWEHAMTSVREEWRYEFFFSKKGMPEEVILALYNRQYGTAFDPAEIVRIKHEFFRAHASEFGPIPHVVELVWKYGGVLPMAVASGGTREIVDLELRALGIHECFQAVVTADDGVEPKPSPEIFLEAAKRIGVPPQFCQVFEDGDLGLEAALKAGMLPTDIRTTLTDAASR
jgi:beta-phosphoglucomutase-like phosphatase (HAD superfamily)